MGKMREVWEGEAAGHRWGDGAQRPRATGTAVFLSMSCECINSSHAEPGLSLELQFQSQQWTEPVEVPLLSQTSPALHWGSVRLAGCGGNRTKTSVCTGHIKGQFLCLNTKH